MFNRNRGNVARFAQYEAIDVGRWSLIANDLLHHLAADRLETGKVQISRLFKQPCCYHIIEAAAEVAVRAMPLLPEHGIDDVVTLASLFDQSTYFPRRILKVVIDNNNVIPGRI